MSFSFPLLFDSRTDNNELGTEFAKIASLGRNRGLLDPMLTDAPVPYVSGTNVKQLDDPREIVPGAEYQTLTTLQAAQNLADEAHSRPLSDMEKVLKSMDTQLDPRVEEAVRQQAFEEGSNIYSENPEDFVDEMKEGVQAYEEERNLFLVNPPPDKVSMEESLDDFYRQTGDVNKDGRQNYQDIEAAGLKGMYHLATGLAKQQNAEAKAPPTQPPRSAVAPLRVDVAPPPARPPSTSSTSSTKGHDISKKGVPVSVDIPSDKIRPPTRAESVRVKPKEPYTPPVRGIDDMPITMPTTPEEARMDNPFASDHLNAPRRRPAAVPQKKYQPLLKPITETSAQMGSGGSSDIIHVMMDIAPDFGDEIAHFAANLGERGDEQFGFEAREAFGGGFP